ncbi:MAG: DUF4230 domain-containing protein [Bacteroidetes bacterium]|nr:DUF4230 domain-containing protein [Bacteroidota bacterium]
MKSPISKIVSIVIIVLLSHFLVLKPLTNWWNKKSEPDISSTVILKEVKKVMKLVSIEGNFSELMNYSDFETIDFPGFRKKAIVKVDAKVLYGFDLERLKFDVDEEKKTMTLGVLPKPQIIAIETDISYYDISEGLFNSFSEAELSQLNKKAKEMIVKKAENSSMRNQTNEQANEILYLLSTYAESNGWKFIYPKANLNLPKK